MTDRRNTPRIVRESAPRRSVPAVPPGSTALREFCHAVVAALTIPAAAIPPGMSSVRPADELACLRVSSDRSRLVLQTMRRILADREIDDHDLMVFVVSLREQSSDYPADGYHHAGLPS
jgi:hypothetical protein